MTEFLESVLAEQKFDENSMHHPEDLNEHSLDDKFGITFALTEF